MPNDKMFGCALCGVRAVLACPEVRRVHPEFRRAARPELEPAMMWVLLAPGLASCFCFITEGFIESLRQGFEAIGRCRGKIW